MQIFLLDGDAQTGPYSAEEFERMLRVGTVAKTALYWHEGCTDWLPVTEHPDFSQRLSLTPLPPRPPPRPTTPSLAFRPAGPLKFCPACGHAVAKSAASCPNCGGRLGMGCLPKLAAGIGALVVVYLMLGLLNAMLSKGTPQAQREKAPRVPPAVADAPPQRSQAAVTPLPGAEAAFIDTVTSYTSRYASAGNELQKSAVRTERRTALAHTVTDLRVSAWVGTLQKLETMRDGKASISVQLEGTTISVETGVGNPFDVASSTIIEHGSALYNKLASLSVGDRVTFSGSFLPGEQDHLQETSFTEVGSMTKPSFAMRFSGVEPFSATSTAMPVVTPTIVVRAEPSPSVTPAPVATATPPPVLPPDEVTFIDIIQSYGSRYSAASNELQKSTLRAERARRLARLMTTMQVARWVGTLREMSTASDGTATVAIRLPESAITVKTVWINPFDPASKTLIDPHSSLYQRLSSMSTGSEVTFSGNFLSGEPDYLKETSFTEAGSMTEPEFAMRFADVTALASTASAIPGVQPSLSIAQTGPLDSSASSPAVSSTPLPLSVTAPGVAASPSEGSATGASRNTAVSERLLIGKWQGARHVTEYRADHTRVMDGVNLNPPRTWHLDGDQLSEEPGKNVYKVVSLDQHQLVLEGDKGMWYSHQRIQAPAVNETGTKPLDPTSSAWMTVFNFYDWYLDCDGQGLSPWKNGLLAQRPDVTRTFAARSQSANEPEGEADPILAGQHVPIRGFVIDAKVEGLVATVLVRLAVRDIPHEVNVRLVRSTLDAPWQIDDVKPASRSTTAPSQPNVAVPEGNIVQRIQLAEDHLNTVYGQLRTRLDARQKARLKQEEIEWVKRKDALAQGDPQRISLIDARIAELAHWDEPTTSNINQGFMSVSATPVSPPTSTPQASGTTPWATGSWPLVLYKGKKISWQLPLPDYWHIMEQPLDANADASWIGPKGTVLTAYSFDDDDLDDFWKALKKSVPILQIDGPRVGQQPLADAKSSLGYDITAQSAKGMQLRGVMIARIASGSDKLLALSVRTPTLGFSHEEINGLIYASRRIAASLEMLATGVKLDMSAHTVKNDAFLIELARAGKQSNSGEAVKPREWRFSNVATDKVADQSSNPDASVSGTAIREKSQARNAGEDSADGPWVPRVLALNIRNAEAAGQSDGFNVVTQYVVKFAYTGGNSFEMQSGLQDFRNTALAAYDMLAAKHHLDTKIYDAYRRGWQTGFDANARTATLTTN